MSEDDTVEEYEAALDERRRLLRTAALASNRTDRPKKTRRVRSADVIAQAAGRDGRVTKLRSKTVGKTFMISSLVLEHVGILTDDHGVTDKDHALFGKRLKDSEPDRDPTAGTRVFAEAGTQVYVRQNEHHQSNFVYEDACTT